MIRRHCFFRTAVLSILVVSSFVASAQPYAEARGGGSSIFWTVRLDDYNSTILRVADPNGVIRERRFARQETIILRVEDLDKPALDGEYNWELFIVPNVSPEVVKQLAQARAKNDDEAARRIMEENGLTDKRASGGISVVNGAFVDTDAIERGQEAQDAYDKMRDAGTASAAPSGGPGPGKVAVNDQVIPDDLIVTGNLCVGFDCVNGEVFDIDDIRIKEQQIRVHYDDTSGAGFPSNSWRVIVNDLNGGGLSKYSIEDSNGAKTPLTIEAGATTNSIYADSTGRIGFRTSTPVLDLHINTSNTPAIRLEQNNSGGFTAQTWDIGANEANFFIRDVTSGSRMPLRIRPGAPTSSLDISADGDIGIGGASPNANTQVDVENSTQLKARIALTGQEYFQPGNTSGDGVALVLGVNRTNDRQLWLTDTSGLNVQSGTQGVIRFRPFDGDISAISTNATAKNLILQSNAGAANVGIGCTTPTFDLMIGSGGGCATPTSGINAGSTSFTTASSRTFKENINEIQAPDILEKISSVGVYTYDFIGGPKDRLGLIAEDFHEIFGRGDEKYIDGQDIKMALWLAVQQLTEQNKSLQERLQAVEQELAEIKR